MRWRPRPFDLTQVNRISRWILGDRIFGHITIINIARKFGWAAWQRNHLMDALLRKFCWRHWYLWFACHDPPPLSSCSTLDLIVKPLFVKAAIKFRLICSLVIDGVNLANTGLVARLCDFVIIVHLLFSNFSEMQGAQSRFQISPVRKKTNLGKLVVTHQ